MAAKKVLNRKEFLKTDEASTLLEKGLAFIETNYRQIVAGVLTVCIVAVCIGLWRSGKIKAENESLLLFTQAMQAMTEKRPGAAVDAAGFQKALQGFLEIQQKHAGTKAGAAALYYAGVCSFNLEQYDGAIGYYQDFLKKAGSKMDYLRPSAYGGLGYAYEEKGQFQQALEWFEKQKSEEGTSLNPSPLLNLARCYAAAGNSAKACELYKEFVEKHPTSAFVESARIKVADLCGR